MIRQARPEDVPEILEMIRELAEYERSLDQVEATEEALHASLFCDRPAVFCHVVEHDVVDHGAGPDDRDGGLAGFALWFLNYSTWQSRHGIYLEDLYVRPRRRGHGYGKALLRELARIAVERGYGRLQWWVLDWNEPSIRFYKKLGATAMDEWTVYRVTGAALRQLAAGGDAS